MKDIKFRYSGNRPDIGFFEVDEIKTFEDKLADELVNGRIAEYVVEIKPKKTQTLKKGE